MKRIFLTWTLTFSLITGLITPAHSCTIFLLTDTKRTLFFNNEDFSNPATFIWFLPGGKDTYGAAYVGFDDHWAQGGVNSAGLAFDWVAGFQNQFVPDITLNRARGNSAERMLESCATIDEAIAFYKKHQESSFSMSRILIADKTGASVIIGALNGQLFFERSTESRGFGYGQKTLAEELENGPKPSLKDGLPILTACQQQGQFGTKYSTVYDLRSGDIFLVPSNSQKRTKFNLKTELARGGHYYNIPDLRKQLKQPLMPLLPGMYRYFKDAYTPLTNEDTVSEQRFKTIFEDSVQGNLKEEYFTPELWKQIAPTLKEIQADVKKLGKLQAVTLVDRKEINGDQSYLYLMEFEKHTVLQRFVLTSQNLVSVIKSEGFE